MTRFDRFRSCCDSAVRRSLTAVRARGRGCLRDEQGATTVELALVAPLVFLLLFGIIEFGIAAYQWSMVTEGARLGARYAMVRGDESGYPTNDGDVRDTVRARMASPSLTVNTTWVDAAGTRVSNHLPGTYVRVEVETQFTPIGFFLPGFAITSVSQAVIVN